ncbi:MAG: proline iminopeptidase-family hydrolase, partial [Candidatus Dormiibacterota bacterium]
VFYDQLGSGRSPVGARPVEWTVRRFVEELATVREALHLDQLVLFGNSWGGMLALQYLLDRSPQLHGLILSSTPFSVSRWLADAALLRSALPLAVRTALDYHEKSSYFGCPEYQGAVAEYYRRHLCRLSPWPDALERTFAGMGVDVYNSLWGPSEFGPVTGELADFEVADRLHQVAVPTLVTGGRFDEARPEHMELLASSIDGAELAIFEQSAHLAFLEERSDYVARLRSFLYRIDAGS